MILDAYKDGVQIFTDSNVTSIKGNEVIKVCEEIYKRVVLVTINETTGREEITQLYELYIDVGGIGAYYKNCLTNMGLRVGDIRYRRIDSILPIRTDYIYNSKINENFDIRPVFY